MDQGKDAADRLDEGGAVAADLPLRSAAPDTPPGATPLDASAPKRIGDYVVLAQLGIGGMGTVYLGEAPDGTSVAIKVVHHHLAADREFRERFVQEVRAGQRVPAYCTARYIDSGSYEGRPYLVSEYIDGVPVSDLVAVEGPMDEATLQSLAVGAATCLVGIHRAGLVHRDVKPGNVLLALAGVRIIDFGIARAMDATTQHTRTGMVMASLGWAAPEQLNGEPASPAMDVFSWGALVAYAATGKHPYGGPDVAARVARIMHAEPDLTGVPASLRTVVASALRRDPGERPTAEQLLDRLGGLGGVTGGFPSPRDFHSRRDAHGRRDTHGRRDASAGPPAAAAKATNERTGPERRRRQRVVAFAAGVPLAALLVIGAANGMRPDDPSQPSVNRPDGGTSRVAPGVTGDPAIGGTGPVQQVDGRTVQQVAGVAGEPGADGAAGPEGAPGAPAGGGVGGVIATGGAPAVGGNAPEANNPPANNPPAGANPPAGGNPPAVTPAPTPGLPTEGTEPEEPEPAGKKTKKPKTNNGNGNGPKTTAP